jgi:hypothetical protein
MDKAMRRGEPIPGIGVGRGTQTLSKHRMDLGIGTDLGKLGV